jgi:hypothetical protein
MDSDYLLECFKIGIAIVFLYIIIKSLVQAADENEIKCLCDCVNQTIKTIYLK